MHLDLVYYTVGSPTQVFFYVNYLPSVQNQLFKLDIWALLLLTSTPGPLQAIFLVRDPTERTDLESFRGWCIFKERLSVSGGHRNHSFNSCLIKAHLRNSIEQNSCLGIFKMEQCECVGLFSPSFFLFLPCGWHSPGLLKQLGYKYKIETKALLVENSWLSIAWLSVLQGQPTSPGMLVSVRLTLAFCWAGFNDLKVGRASQVSCHAPIHLYFNLHSN